MKIFTLSALRPLKQMFLAGLFLLSALQPIRSEAATNTKKAVAENKSIEKLLRIPPTNAPVMASFSPASGPVGTLVTITGTDLSDPTAITIGGTAAVVISNTSTAVVAMVMPGANTGAISFATSNGAVTSTGSFTITSSAVPNRLQGSKLSGSGRHGGSVAVSADGNTAIVGVSTGAMVYTRDGSNWVQQGTKLVGSGGIGNIIAAAVAISADGNTAIIGGYYDNSGRGAIWVFIRNNGIWIQQGTKLVPGGVTTATNHGWSVSLSADGNTAISGGYGHPSHGAAWIWTRNSDEIWSEQSILIGTGSIAKGQFKPQIGHSVSLSADGNTAIVGGNRDNGEIGAAWIFTRSGTTWTQQGDKLVGNDNVGKSDFGSSVSLSANGNTALIGGAKDNGIGAAWIFTRTGTTWTQQGNKLVGTGSVGNALQGNSVSISADGNTAIVGGYLDNPSGPPTYVNSGAVWVYTRNTEGAWSQQGDKLTDPANSIDAQLGGSVSLSADGNTALVGGPGDNVRKGAVWVYVNIPVPAITSFTPMKAIVGSTITITGTNFTGATAVTFGGTSAASFTVISPTSISAVVGAGSSGEVSVTTAGGTALLPGFTILTPPVIAYDSPQTYLVDAAISALLPSSTGGSVPATIYGSISELGSGFASPQNVAVDASGNIYVADFGNSAIKKIAVSDGAVTSLGSGFSVPTGVAVDDLGNVYVADYGNNAIKKIAAADGAVTVLLAGIIRPRNVAVDGLGNVYVADPENSAVKKIAASDGSVTSVGSGFNMPLGIKIDVSGNIFVADWNYPKIKKIDTNGTITELGSGFVHPFNVEIDALGNVYVADNGDNTIKKIAVSDGSVSTLGSGFNNPLGVAVDGLGNVYVADQSSSKIKKIVMSGYTISPALPAGLSFDGTTGAISGTPSAASAVADYTVTAYNSSGSSSATISIAVAYPAPQIVSELCGTTLESMNTKVNANKLPLATKYRFRVTKDTDVQTIDVEENVFQMTQLTTFAYNTTYSIDVAAEIDGDWGDYGTACDVTTPTGITNVSSTQSDGTYGIGAVVPITVNFSGDVKVTGTPVLVLNSGGKATYVSGDESSALTFNYTVKTGEQVEDLDYNSNSSLDLSGGTIEDLNGVNTDISLPVPGGTSSLAANHDLLIDGILPTLSDIAIASNNSDVALAKTGDVITVTFTASEVLAADPVVTIAGQSATVNALLANKWTATYTMVGTETEGNILFSIVFSDLAGNAGTSITATSDDSKVIFNATLPISLIDYQLKLQGSSSVLVTWLTASESRNEGFELFRSTDGISFHKIATLKGQGDTEATKLYSFTDYAPAMGTNYYRLIQIDLDGSRNEIGLKPIRFEFKNTAPIQVFPNPARDIVTITFEEGKFSNLVLMDLTGKIILRKAISAADNKKAVSISALPPANYLIRLSGPSETVSKLLVTNP